ncbi:MAG: hypothetical protein ACREFS_04630 [Acetobacteraceae bacterium]
MSRARTATASAVAPAPGSWPSGAAASPQVLKHGAIGTPVTRVDGPLKVTGKARFAAEVPLPGLTYAAWAYSTIYRDGSFAQAGFPYLGDHLA